MTSTPKLLSLFWRSEIASLPNERTVRVALHHVNVLDELEPVLAVILFPAFLTPAVHVEADNDGMFEILVLARSNPPLTAAEVNLHLKMTLGLDAQKSGSNQPLFSSTKDNIVVKVVAPDGNGTLKTENTFRGQLDRRIRDRLKSDATTSTLDTYYSIRIKESCLNDKSVIQGGERVPTAELQDQFILSTLLRMNGDRLRQKKADGGRGTHCFTMTAEGSNIAQIDIGQPIVAYHPLCFYPKDSLKPASFGHVSDIHLNSRQQVMRRSPARVIDDPQAANHSPAIGGLMNVYGQSFHAILEALGKDARMDVLLAGGDYMDHARNVYPYQPGHDAAQLANPSARAVWELMDVRPGHGYETNYQSFVDLICLFGELRWFYDAFAKPVFGVTGNHDCYGAAYGISPRIAGTRANEGIPADHNLTFYEAILGFGESFDHLQSWSSSFDPTLFEWYYTVFTPFSDFTFELPNQRLAALGWGEDEEVISMPGSGGQGFGHLPRAEEAVSDAQLALYNLPARNNKKTVLFTHFTFISYNESVSEVAGSSAAARQLNVAGTGLFQWHSPFTEFDMGTFELNRRALYASVADSSKTQFAVSGHSHRKGVYFLGAHDGDRYATEMHGLRRSLAVSSLPNASSRTPIIVSDSAGPTPRLNIEDEFETWGSDLPAGSLVVVSPNGQVQSVEAVVASVPQAKPRLAVTLDYLHVMNGHVFDEIETMPFPSSRARQIAHEFRILFHERFPANRCQLESLVLYCRASVGAPWRQIPMTVGAWNPIGGQRQVTCRADRSDAPAVFEWLTMAPKAGRFMSMRFRATDPNANGIYEQQSAWNIEVDCRPARTNLLPWTDNSYVIIPRAGHDSANSRPAIEGPSFAWRRRFREYQ